MKSTTHLIHSLKQTRKLGEALGRFSLPGDVIGLDGDLGAGKTTLSQCIAVGLNVPEKCYVTSPSFAILHEYPGRLTMYHMDFYRLQDYTEVEDLGFEEYFYLSGLTVIEWSQRAEEILPGDMLRLHISIQDEYIRAVTFTYDKEKWARRLEQIFCEIGINS